MIVHTISGQSIQGVLFGVYADAVVLRHAQHLDEKTDLGGELVIPRDRIDFFQTVEAPTHG